MSWAYYLSLFSYLVIVTQLPSVLVAQIKAGWGGLDADAGGVGGWGVEGRGGGSGGGRGGGNRKNPKSKHSIIGLQ